MEKEHLRQAGKPLLVVLKNHAGKKGCQHYAHQFPTTIHPGRNQTQTSKPQTVSSCRTPCFLFKRHRGVRNTCPTAHGKHTGTLARIHTCGGSWLEPDGRVSSGECQGVRGGACLHMQTRARALPPSERKRKNAHEAPEQAGSEGLLI